MNYPATLDAFPVGCVVRIARLPRHHWLPTARNAVGIVAEHIDEDGEYCALVAFQPSGETLSFRPWWLERGHVAWFPDHRPDQPIPLL